MLVLEGFFSAYELIQLQPTLKVAVFEAGHPLEKRKCPIDGEKIKTCSIMSGFGGAGAFSDGKYNITNDFGGTLYEYIEKKRALDLMKYVDEINLKYGGEGTKLYTTAGSRFKTVCIQNDLHLLDASVRHLGTDINYIVLENIYNYLKDKVEFFFDTPVLSIANEDGIYKVNCKDETYECSNCIISVGRIGSKWMETVCKDLKIPTKSNRVEVKFYNMEVEVDENLESTHRGLYIIGDGSGITHSLSHASASGVHVARKIAK